MNITAGVPLTDEIKASRKFCNADGLFAFKRERCLYFSTAEREALAAEVAAQIARCQSHGLPLTHVDTHHHVHAEFPVFRVIAPLLRQYNIRCVRLTRNIGAMSWLRRGYKAGYNAWLKWQGFWTTDYFGLLSDGPLIQQYAHDNRCILEIMLHPGYNRQGELIDLQVPYSLPQQVASLLAESRLLAYPLIQ